MLINSAAAQDGKGWLGADFLDVTKAEADKFGWDVPHGAKVGVVASGSPADKAGLNTGDIVLAIDRTVIDTSSEAEAAVAAKHPGDELRLQVLSGARERRLAATLSERPKARVAEQRRGAGDNLQLRRPAGAPGAEFQRSSPRPRRCSTAGAQ